MQFATFSGKRGTFFPMLTSCLLMQVAVYVCSSTAHGFVCLSFVLGSLLTQIFWFRSLSRCLIPRKVPKLEFRFILLCFIVDRVKHERRVGNSLPISFTSVLIRQNFNCK